MPSRPLSLRFALALAALLVTATSGHAQKPDAESPPSGTVSGQVSLHGKPVAGVVVAAIAGDTINRRDSATRTLTDGQGYYRLTGLPHGQYQIWTLTPGLIAELEPFPGYFPHGSVKTILLSANEDVAHVDLKLVNGSVITGRVTTSENKPIVEERVLLEFLDEKGDPKFPVQRAGREEMYRTDDRGIYRLYGLPPGRYKVSVGYDPNEGVRSSQYSRTYHSASTDPAKPVIVELKEGDEADSIDIKVGERLPTFAVSGRIIDSTTGRPVSGIRCRISVVEKDQSRTPSFSGLPTDSAGEFRFDGLRPGHYKAVAVSEYSGGGNYYGDAVDFEIVDQDVAGLVIKAVPGLTLSGVVVADELTTRELLALLPELRVHAWPETPAPTQATGSGNAVVAADGTFHITGLRPGRLRVDVSSNVRGAARPTVARIEREGVAIDRTVEVQESTAGIVVVLGYGTGSIRGTITFAGGSLPADSRIFVTFRREGGRDEMSVQTDMRGHFVLNNLRPGTYELDVRLAFSNRAPRAHQPQKQFVNVKNGSVSEVSFLVDFGQTRIGQ